MFRKLLFAVSLIALLATACGSTRTDALNRTIKLNGPAKRIVSLAPSNTELLFAVGAGSQVVGRDTFSDYPDEAGSIQDIGGSNGKYNTEAILALKPDLVLAGEINPPELVTSMEQLGLTVYYLKNPATLEDMYANVETVGSLTGHVSQAAALVDSLKGRVAAVDAKIAQATSSVSVYYELDASDPTKPFTAGPGTFVDLLIQRAGGTNIGAKLTSPWAQISLEEVVASDPEFIILGDSAYGVTPESVKQRAGWEGISAVKNGRIYPFDDNLVSRPGPRLVDGLEALAKLLHPELFK
jgi:iron complex transport system substrate-binding protein